MAVYKTTFCKIGYNDEITTSTDPENVCTGLGLNGTGRYTFPVSIPDTLIAASNYTRTYFISSANLSDTWWHDYDEYIAIDEDQHGSVGAMEVKISGLNINYGYSEEVVKLNGQTPVQVANHYHRINEIKVVTTGRLLANVGDIYVSALDGVRTSSLLNLEDYVSSGVPISTQYIYGKIIESENRMLSSHYTVPRSHTLYIDSIRILTDIATICNWILQAGVNGSLHTILKSRSSSDFNDQNKGLSFNTPYVFPAGSDIIITMNTVGGTTDVTSIMEGYLISQEKLELENNMRKTLEEQILITRYEEIGEEEFVESEYKDEEFSEIPGYGGIEKEGEYDDEGDKYYPPSDAGSYEEECPSGYKWCEDLRQCIDERSGCEGMMPI
jgi:hypothetical protein